MKDRQLGAPTLRQMRDHLSPKEASEYRAETPSVKFPGWKSKYFSEDIFPLLLGW